MNEFQEHLNEIDFMLDEAKEMYESDTRVLRLALELATEDRDHSLVTTSEHYIKKAHLQINNELTNNGMN